MPEIMSDLQTGTKIELTIQIKIQLSLVGDAIAAKDVSRIIGDGRIYALRMQAVMRGDGDTGYIEDNKIYIPLDSLVRLRDLCIHLRWKALYYRLDALIPQIAHAMAL